MKKILVTYGTRPLAQRVKQILQNQFDVYFATCEEIPSILTKSYSGIPTGANPTFAHEVLKLALDLGINYILPLGKQELLPFAEAKILFEEYDIELLVPSKERLEDLFILENPNKEMNLDVFIDGRSIIQSRTIDFADFSGLGLVSDDEDDVVLCVVQ
ncbi:hypothetical protein [Sphingobacterium hungaricum]|uniref:Uncharacterized protein n=1 Tax=Sphingobacterium hungaricum TaxID=2082723 RepID=A0A928UTZ9_9SPHI|nr:hypothetical protein [Sphingobacterium hungaricum]MBE8713311.1 hypothetical protein [Sphingobacterium hungaricum]